MNSKHHPSQWNDQVLSLLQCPRTGEKLLYKDHSLVAESSNHRYPITEAGIPLFAGDYCSAEALAQQGHYDSDEVNKGYLENLTYPHTQAYFSYLDEMLIKQSASADLGTAAEICCGRGEAFLLFKDRMGLGIGLDISQKMLEHGRETQPEEHLRFLQGDATQMPLDSGCFDTVMMLGGIHHINDRQRLYSEIYRILKPGGRLIWREPVDDFFAWRWMRNIIYRISPALDHLTEHPLRYQSTYNQLTQANLKLIEWKTYGFIGYMLFMNSDIIFPLRLLRHVPNVERFVRRVARFDDWLLSLPGMHNRGVQVIGVAQKPG